MGGPKAALELEGKSLAARAADTLRSVASPVLAVLGKDSPPLSIDVPVLTDRVPEKGPLEGLAVGLAALAVLDPAPEWALVLACDLPFVRPRLLQGLAALRNSVDAVVPRTADGLHPLLACYRVAIHPRIDEALLGGDLSLHALLGKLSVREVEESELRALDPDLRSFWNVNTAADLTEGLRRFGRAS